MNLAGCFVVEMEGDVARWWLDGGGRCRSRSWRLEPNGNRKIG